MTHIRKWRGPAIVGPLFSICWRQTCPLFHATQSKTRHNTRISDANGVNSVSRNESNMLRDADRADGIRFHSWGTQALNLRLKQPLHAESRVDVLAREPRPAHGHRFRSDARDAKAARPPPCCTLSEISRLGAEACRTPIDHDVGTSRPRHRRDVCDGRIRLLGDAASGAARSRPAGPRLHHPARLRPRFILRLAYGQRLRRQMHERADVRAICGLAARTCASSCNVGQSRPPRRRRHRHHYCP